MFFQQVWRHSKPLFLLMMVFVIGQLTVTYKRGMLFSPFFNYWMYSSPFSNTESIPVTLVYSSGKPLEGSDFSQRDWDKILLTYDYATNGRENSFVAGEIDRISRKFTLHMELAPYQIPESLYTSGVFLKQWKAMMLRDLQIRVDSVQVSEFRWNGKTLVRR